jgi:hypothetical protein
MEHFSQPSEANHAADRGGAMFRRLAVTIWRRLLIGAKPVAALAEA